MSKILVKAATGITYAKAYDNANGGVTWSEPGSVIRLAVNVDGSTIEIASNALAIKAGGVGTTQLAAQGVTFAKIQNIASARLLGNPTGGAASASEISLISGHLAFTGTTLGLGTTGVAAATYGSSTQVGQFTVDTYGRITSATNVTISVSTASLANSSVTYAKLQDISGLSVPGRASNTTGVMADITAGTDGYVLRRSGTTIGFGEVATAGIANAAITFAKFQNIAATSLFGNATGSSAVGTAITVSNGLTFSSGTLVVQAADSTVTVASGGISVGTLGTSNYGASTVTFAKLQNSAAGLSVIGRSTNSAGVFAEITAGTDGYVLLRSGTSLAFSQVGTAGIANLAVTTGLLAATAVTFAKMQTIAAYSVIGNNTTGTGAPVEITASANGVLRRSATGVVQFGTLDNSAMFGSQVIVPGALLGAFGVPLSAGHVVTVGGGGTNFEGSTINNLIDGALTSDPDLENLIAEIAHIETDELQGYLAGEVIERYMPVSLRTVSGTPRIMNARADMPQYPIYGFLDSNAVALGDPVRVHRGGWFLNADFGSGFGPSITTGTYYLADTGGLSQTAPTASGTSVQQLMVSFNGTSCLMDIGEAIINA